VLDSDVLHGCTYADPYRDVHNDFTLAGASEGNTGKVKSPKLTMNKVNERTPNSHSFQQIYMTMFAIRYNRFSHLPNMIGAITKIYKSHPVESSARLKVIQYIG